VVRPLVFLELFLAPDRLVLDRDWAAAFRRRATAPTPTAPAAPAATSEAGAAAFLATRPAPLRTLFALLCFLLKIANSCTSSVWGWYICAPAGPA
jgi:hypothetical protein